MIKYVSGDIDDDNDNNNIIGFYIWLSCTLSVVASAAKGTITEPVLDIICICNSLYYFMNFNQPIQVIFVLQSLIELPSMVNTFNDC
jgi:hypothetical protein